MTIIGVSALASRFVDRFTPKPALVAGLLISTAGFVLLTRVTGHGDYASHVLPAMIVLGTGLGMSFVPITIAATNGVAAGDSGLASGLLNTTQQVGGSLGLAILSSVSTSRATSVLHDGSPLQAALTHGFKGAFTVAAALCAAGVVVALALLPSRRREAGDAHVEAVAMSFARCPGAPYCGHLARGRPRPPSAAAYAAQSRDPRRAPRPQGGCLGYRRTRARSGRVGRVGRSGRPPAPPKLERRRPPLLAAQLHTAPGRALLATVGTKHRQRCEPAGVDEQLAPQRLLEPLTARTVPPRAAAACRVAPRARGPAQRRSRRPRGRAAAVVGRCHGIG